MDQRIVSKRERIKEIAQKYKARNIRVFGSQMRGEEQSDSDGDSCLIALNIIVSCATSLPVEPIMSREM